MEKWIEVFKNIIPNDIYTVEIKSGEEVGIIVNLESIRHLVNLDFGAVTAYRMIDEGVILQGLFDELEVEKYKQDSFANKIYKIENGQFGQSIKKIYGELYDILGCEHYVIITMNYVIEIVSQWEPELEVVSK
jgi:hypothetical protein